LPDSFRIGQFHVEPSLHSVSGPAGTVRLEAKVMQVLLCLAEHGDQVVPKERLMRAVWRDTFVGDDVLTRAISELRRVFGDDTRNPRFIQTIPKSGYRLMAPVTFTSPDANSTATAQPARTEALQSRHLGVAARGEAERAPTSPRAWLRSWKRALATMAVLAAVLLAGVVVQRMATPPSARVVRSVQLTFTGHVRWPATDIAFFPGLGTDGGRVYFTQMTGNRRLTLAQSSVGGGEVVTIRTPFKDALLLNVSPDGSRLLVRDFDVTQLEGTLWVIPAVGGAPLRLGAVVAHDGAWSPDSTRIVFARGEELFVAGSDGSNPRKLATTPGRAFWVRWSPDGARLRFTIVSPQGYQRLWEVSTEGRDLRPVPLSRREHDVDCCGEWSPDGRHFFFRRFRDDRPDIWAVRERTGLFGGRTSEPGRVTSGPLLFPAGVPTRDGRRLLVIAGQPRGKNLRFDSGTREFAPYDAGKWGRWFAFSRDGQWVAYVQAPENILWRSRVDGSARLQLTQPPLQLLLPRWSPDGTRIAFMGRTPGRPWKIYAIAAEGGEAQPILEGERPEADPDWSPDGKSLMFGRPPDYLAEPAVPKAIHLLDLRTKELSTLPGSEGLFGSRWSPSGRFVAAVSLDHARLLLFDFRTQAWTELGRFKYLNNPVWSRDERFLYFQEVVDEASIYRVRISDSAVERVVGLQGVWSSAYSDCEFVGVAPDDSLLIGCGRTDTDIYALDWEMR
jgi:DNA-binding winged helix-turn-helix (wHTH) protein/Tol biopolymer transport system component